MLVPPNGKFWVAPTSASATIGIRAMRPRYSEPGAVSRVSTKLRYSAVGRPGRMPGMNPPYFFMLSATSVGLNVIATHHVRFDPLEPRLRVALVPEQRRGQLRDIEQR